jgi:hypothetical protein
MCKNCCQLVVATAGVMMAGCERSAYELPDQQKKTLSTPPSPQVERVLVVKPEPVAEVALELREWVGRLTVQRAIAHGALVGRGDVLVQLDLSEIDGAIKDLHCNRALANEAVELAEMEIVALEDSVKAESSAAVGAEQIADGGRSPLDGGLEGTAPESDDAATGTLESEAARNASALLLTKKKNALEKLKRQDAKSAERLQRLEKDRSAMTIRAPVGGLVYFGRGRDGNWSTPAETAPQLRPGAIVSVDEVVMTVVVPRPSLVQAKGEERDATRRNDKAGNVGFPALKRPAW